MSKLEEDIKEKEPQDRKGIKNQFGSKNGPKNNSNETNEFLREIYYDTRNLASFSGVKKFKRPVVIAFIENYQWDTDTANMVKYKEFNQGYGYFAVFIDIFTRFVYTYPMKNLTGVEMVQAIEKILET